MVGQTLLSIGSLASYMFDIPERNTFSLRLLGSQSELCDQGYLMVDSGTKLKYTKPQYHLLIPLLHCLFIKLVGWCGGWSKRLPRLPLLVTDKVAF